jgi:hypothetical protein
MGGEPASTIVAISRSPLVAERDPDSALGPRQRDDEVLRHWLLALRAQVGDPAEDVQLATAR